MSRKDDEAVRGWNSLPEAKVATTDPLLDVALSICILFGEEQAVRSATHAVHE